MGRKRLAAEQIVTKLRQIEVLQGQGKTIAMACKEAGTTEQSYYRWRRLKKLVTDLSLEKQVLQDIAQGNL